MTTETARKKPRAVLVAVQTPDIDDDDLRASLDELSRLVTTLGYEPVGRLHQKRPRPDTGVVLGEGKLRELAEWTGGSGVVERGPAQKRKGGKRVVDGTGDDEHEGDGEEAGNEEGGEPPPPKASRRADVVVVDHELSPMQVKNLHAATSAEVLDRTGVIVEIFHHHAASRRARMQVEIARLAYLAPRIRAGGGGDRQRGGIGGKGAGESAIELDRRRIRDRIAELRRQIDEMGDEDSVRRAKRRDVWKLALVGYTNAGKSSWMRALTGSEVLVEDKLFATLDTTVRALHPETNPRILVGDTVGFIRKLPHDLVASFKSTLDEAKDATLLVHVVDAADEQWRAQLDVTLAVLDEIGASDVPSLLLLNKADRLTAEARRALSAEREQALIASAHDEADVRRVRDALVAWFFRNLPEADLLIPWALSRLLGDAHRIGTVLREEHREDGVAVRLRAPQPEIDKLRAQLP